MLASLADDDGTLLVGEVSGLSQRLDSLQRQWSSQASNQNTENFGYALFQALIPERLQGFFAGAAPCHLQLTAHPRLLAVPWEAAFDGKRHWTGYHLISRHILGQPTPRGKATPIAVNAITIRVLVVDMTLQANHFDYLHDLAQGIAKLPGLSLRQTTPEALQNDSIPDPFHVDILHLVGTHSACMSRITQDTALRDLAHEARLLIIDSNDSTRDSRAATTWFLLGEQVAALAREAGNFCLIQRAAAATGVPSGLALLYEDIQRGAPLIEWTRRSDSASDRLTSLMSVFGDPQLSFNPVAGAEASHRSFRQVTTLSYDLVGSTSLMRRIGVELYSIALLDCHKRFASIVQQWGGISDEPQGDDGIMCYFGARQAREDTAASAIYAGLDLVEQASLLGIQIRVGLATGQVAISADQFVGLTIHLAARIQSLASAGELMVSGVTAELAQAHFSFQPVRYKETLKGFSETPTVFRVVAPRPRQLREQWPQGANFALSGRDAELEQLDQLWESVSAGRSLWLHLTGEAGIGKSRLISTFVSSLEKSKFAQSFTCRCFAETRHRPFSPIIDLLERWFRIVPGDNDLTRKKKVAEIVASQGLDESNHEAVNHLLGISYEATGASQPAIAETRRRFILRVTTDWLMRQSLAKPACFIVEDIQWADPSTIEFLQTLRSKSSEAPLLTVLTERTESDRATFHELADKSVHLTGLASKAVKEMIHAISASTPLSRQVVNAIEAKSDGIPLFVEMSTRMVLESRIKEIVPGGTGSDGDFPIPITIRELLTQRLDNLGPARHLAQLCGVLGREFSLDLLKAIASNTSVNVPPDQLHQHLSVLLKSGLLVTSNDPQNPSYFFRHALIQDAAYQSMWETDRRNLHQVITIALEKHFPLTASLQPEMLARHYAAFGAHHDAIKWHLVAVKKYKANESHHEALSHLSVAGSLLVKLPVSAMREKMDLEIQLTTAGQLIATKGYGAESVGECYLRALALSQSLGDKKSLLRAELGIEAYYFLRGDFGQAHAYIALANRTAQEFNDALTNAQCQWAIANILFHQGEVETALDKMNACVAHCRATGLKIPLVQSPEVMSLMYSSFCLWELGFPTQALERAEAAVTLAESMKLRLGIGQALGMKAMVQLVCRDAANAKATADRAIEVCEAGQHEMWTAHARFISGAALADLGDLHAGLKIMNEADAQWAATGAILTRTFYLSSRAQAYLSNGEKAEALRLIQEAHSIMTIHGERYWEAEVLRLSAEIHLASSSEPTPTQMADAERILKKAIISAQTRQLHSLTLRASSSLAKLYQSQGHLDQAVLVLSPALEMIREGMPSSEVSMARNLLRHLMGQIV